MTCMPLFPDLFSVFFMRSPRFRCYKLHALPGTGRSKSRGKPRRFSSARRVCRFLRAYHFQERGSGLPDGCRRFAGIRGRLSCFLRDCGRLCGVCIRCKVKRTRAVVQNQDFRFFTSARAIERRCFCPPERFFPFCSSIKSS